MRQQKYSKKITKEEEQYKALSWEILESSDYQMIDWYPLMEGQKPEDAKLMIITAKGLDPRFADQGIYYTDPLSSWKEIYYHLTSAESFLTRIKLGSDESWISREDRMKDSYRKQLRKIKNARDAWNKKYGHPAMISLRETLYITHPMRLQKGHTAIDPEIAMTLTASHSWSGNFTTY